MMVVALFIALAAIAILAYLLLLDRAEATDASWLLAKRQIRAQQEATIRAMFQVADAELDDGVGGTD